MWRRMGLAGHVARMTQKVVGRKARKKENTRRPRRRWVTNIRMDLGEIAWGTVVWIGLAQDRDKWTALVNEVMNLWVP
jgi:hypothetical protein